jgi:hypothetical protein
MRDVAISLIGVEQCPPPSGSVLLRWAAFFAVEALKKSEKLSPVTLMLGQNIDLVFRIGAAYLALLSLIRGRYVGLPRTPCSFVGRCPTSIEGPKRSVRASQSDKQSA